MMGWQETMKAAEAAKGKMISDRSSGEKKFQQLLRRHEGDGMVHFQRGLAYEALNELALAVADFTRAEALFPKTEWKASARAAIERIKTLQKTGAASSQESGSGKSRRVFVVHGRNERLRAGMFGFLRSIGLEPIEFLEARQLTGKSSPYIGEIIDAAFRHAQAVVVMLTPDDDVRLGKEFLTPADPAYEKDLTRQARPNVLFEAGMALASHPEQTILVQIGKVKPFSDIGGRHLIQMDNSTQKRQELASRLQDAECSVNRNGTDWHTEGNMEIEVDAPTIVEWTSHTYRRFPSQRELKERKIFEEYARNSSKADYLVLRGRDILSSTGEIGIVCGTHDLRIRLLMLDFESLSEETFEHMKEHLDLEWEDFKKEKDSARQRLLEAKRKWANMSFTCRLLPAEMIPEIKLRLYEDCGFFSFYSRNIGGMGPHGERAIFKVEGSPTESPLLETLRKMFDHLWDDVGIKVR